MKRHWIILLGLAGFLGLTLKGVCHESMSRPVVRFIDFYVAAEEAQRPPSLIEKVAYGLALVFTESPKTPPQTSR